MILISHHAIIFELTLNIFHANEAVRRDKTTDDELKLWRYQTMTMREPHAASLQRPIISPQYTIYFTRCSFIPFGHSRIHD